MTSQKITKHDLSKCSSRLVMHLNYGGAGSATVRQCVEHPRLQIKDRLYKKERRCERTFFVDGEEFSSFDDAIAQLNKPVTEEATDA